MYWCHSLTIQCLTKKFHLGYLPPLLFGSPLWRRYLHIGAFFSLFEASTHADAKNECWILNTIATLRLSIFFCATYIHNIQISDCHYRNVIIGNFLQQQHIYNTETHTACEQRKQESTYMWQIWITLSMFKYQGRTWRSSNFNMKDSIILGCKTWNGCIMFLKFQNAEMHNLFHKFMLFKVIWFVNINHSSPWSSN